MANNNRKLWSRFETHKDQIVFPFAISWQNNDPMYIKRTSILGIHFLCWHLGFWFERG